MADGNDQTPVPEPNSGSRHILAPVAGTPGFEVGVTTSDVKAGMGNVASVQLTSGEGSLFAEHHNLGMLPITAPVQDVPPGETTAKP